MNEAQVLAKYAAADPGREALVTGETGISYGELDETIASLASGLAEIGLGQGDRLLVALPNDPEIPLLMQAAWRIGAIYCPANPRCTQEELGRLIDQVSPFVVVVSNDAHCEVALNVKKAGRRIRIVGSPGTESPDVPYGALLASRRLDAICELRDEDVAFLAFTTGTTGKPKAAMLSHGSCRTAMDVFAEVQDFSPGDRVLQLLPGTSAVCTMTGVLLGWHVGGCASIVEQPDAEKLGEILLGFRPSFFGSVPTFWHDLLLADEDLDFSSLRFVTYGGAGSNPNLPRRVSERYGVKMVQSYGMTEAPMVLASDPWTMPWRADGVGLPMPHLTIEAVDVHGAVLPSRVEGELRVRPRETGVGWAGHRYHPFSGYWNDREATRKALDGDRLLTGDRGFVDSEGVIHVTGRMSELIIRGGNNIAPAELESVLLSDARVDEAYVIAVPDRRLGQVPVAFVVPKEGLTVSGEELLASANRRVAPHKRLEGLRLATAASLPREGMGKVSKSRLRWE